MKILAPKKRKKSDEVCIGSLYDQWLAEGGIQIHKAHKQQHDSFFCPGLDIKGIYIYLSGPGQNQIRFYFLIFLSIFLIYCNLYCRFLNCYVTPQSLDDVMDGSFGRREMLQLMISSKWVTCVLIVNSGWVTSCKLDLRPKETKT